MACSNPMYGMARLNGELTGKLKYYPAKSNGRPAASSRILQVWIRIIKRSLQVFQLRSVAFACQTTIPNRSNRG